MEWIEVLHSGRAEMRGKGHQDLHAAFDISIFLQKASPMKLQSILPRSERRRDMEWSPFSKSALHNEFCHINWARRTPGISSRLSYKGLLISLMYLCRTRHGVECWHMAILQQPALHNDSRHIHRECQTPRTSSHSSYKESLISLMCLRVFSVA
jgi:hypothetical protein